MPHRFTELTVAAQAAYAELSDRTRQTELDRALSGLPGSFHRLDRKGRGYWYYIVARLAEYGLFRAGGVLVGTHAFLVLGNILGVRWTEPALTLDVDIAHAGRNVSVALPERLDVDVHGALQSLRMGSLPISELDGSLGTRYRSRDDGALRVDFLTTFTRSRKPVRTRGFRSRWSHSSSWTSCSTK